jgi:hypothetical protein
MIEILIERGIFRLTDEIQQDAPVVSRAKEVLLPNIELSTYSSESRNTLPIKMNLPMVHPLLDWTIQNIEYFKETGEVPKISDLVGGYLTHTTPSWI